MAYFSTARDLCRLPPVPIGIDRSSDHLPIQIRRTIAPPNRTALSQRNFGLIDLRASVLLRNRFSRLQSSSNLTARCHERVDEPLPLILRQRGVAATPEPAADHEVAAVGGDGVGGRGLFHAIGAIVGEMGRWHLTFSIECPAVLTNRAP